MDVKAGALIDGRFLVERVLDEDDCGTVVSAREAQNGLLVAVKIFPPSIHESRVISRFRRAQKIESAHVPKLFELGGLDDGRTFVAMEYLTGATLSERASRGPLAIGSAVLAVKQASLAVAAAHRAGVIHRRLSLGKLFEARGTAETLTLRVLGFATTLPSSEPEAGGLPVGLEYLAPEQLAGIQQGERAADIWSLGVIFYQLLTGRLPFTALTRKAIAKQIGSDDPKPPRSFRPDIPWQLEQGILRCLDKAPASRPESADELVQLLESFAVLTEPPPRLSAPPQKKPSGTFLSPVGQGGAPFVAPAIATGLKTPTELPQVAKLSHVLSGGTPNAPVEQTQAAFHRLRGDGKIEGVKLEEVAGLARANRTDGQSAEPKDRAWTQESIPAPGALSVAPDIARPSTAPRTSSIFLSTGHIVAILIGAAVVLGLLVGLLLRALLS